MPIGGHFQNIGMSFEYGTLAALGDVQILGNLQKEVTAYSHNNSAFMGFDSANITINDVVLNLEGWLVYGLGRHVRIYGSDLTTIWEGFVNQVTYSVGGVNVTVGPLMSVINRISATFSEVLANQESVAGNTAVTTIQEDAGSQSMYGIIESVINAGSVYRDEADQICSVFLKDKKYPATSLNLNLGGQGSNPSVKLDCLGYAHWLDVFIYDDTTTGTVAASTKVSDVIDADPNNIVLTKDIYTNASLASSYETQNRSGLTVIKGCASLGDGSDNRWLFGMYEDRTAVFNVIPDEVEYIHDVVDERQVITGLGSSRIKPWDVRAGKWIETRDIPVSYAPLSSSDIRSDIRKTFIETVTYTMPYTLGISGTGVDKAPQAIAKYGIGATL